jgi:hypothetical protein
MIDQLKEIARQVALLDADDVKEEDHQQMMADLKCRSFHFMSLWRQAELEAAARYSWRYDGKYRRKDDSDLPAEGEEMNLTDEFLKEVKDNQGKDNDVSDVLSAIRLYDIDQCGFDPVQFVKLWHKIVDEKVRTLSQEQRNELLRQLIENEKIKDQIELVSMGYVE